MGTPSALTYNGYVEALGLMAVEKTEIVSGVAVGVSPEFTANIPLALSYSELRIQRDVGLNQLLTSDTSYTLIAGSNLLTIAMTDFVAVETVSIQGTPLLFVSREWLQNVWGTNANLSQPQYIAPYGGDAATQGNTSTNFIVGPWPDSNYPLTITGTARADSLNAFGNQTDAGTETTFISSQMPDVLLAASMIWISSYQRNFSSAGSDPGMPVNWEQQYKALIQGAQTDEARKRFAAQAWTAQAPTPVATPGR